MLPETPFFDAFIFFETFGSYTSKSGGNVTLILSINSIFPVPLTINLRLIASLAFNSVSSMVDQSPPDMIYKNLNIHIENDGWANSENIVDQFINPDTVRFVANDYEKIDPNTK